MSIIGVILARGGSKGIVHKNLQAVFPMDPIVATAARQAAESDLDLCYVYSDDRDILTWASKLGSKVVPVQRPPEVSGDTTTSEATIARFITDTVITSDLMLIQCTTPFLKARHINQAIKIFQDRTLNLDSALTATRFRRYLGYPRPAGGTNDAKLWSPVFPYRWLRQESSLEMYIENGGLYLAKLDLWKSGRRIGTRCGIVEMGWWESMEIDDPEDLEAARLLCPIFDEVKNGTQMQTMGECETTTVHVQEASKGGEENAAKNESEETAIAHGR